MIYAGEIAAMQMAVEQLEAAIQQLIAVRTHQGVLSPLAELIQQRVSDEVALLQEGLHEPELIQELTEKITGVGTP